MVIFPLVINQNSLVIEIVCIIVLERGILSMELQGNTFKMNFPQLVIIQANFDRDSEGNVTIAHKNERSFVIKPVILEP